jgi:hypothetical protein
LPHSADQQERTATTEGAMTTDNAARMQQTDDAWNNRDWDVTALSETRET